MALFSFHAGLFRGLSFKGRTYSAGSAAGAVMASEAKPSSPAVIDGPTVGQLKRGLYVSTPTSHECVGSRGRMARS